MSAPSFSTANRSATFWAKTGALPGDGTETPKESLLRLLSGS